MHLLKRFTAGVAVSVAAGAVMMSAPAAQAASLYEGCPAGWVCMYPQNAGWNSGHPEHMWYSYGNYNLSNEYGTHRFFNNQTGTGAAGMCLGYNGTGTCYYQPTGTWSDDNFTPINSVRLAAS